MTTHDDPTLVAQAAGDAVTASLAARVQEILQSAERAAVDVRREVEAETMRRSAEVRLAAEEQAARTLEEAERQAAEYLEECRRRVDAFAAGRVQRLARLTDDLTSRAESLQIGFEEASTVRLQLEALIAALGTAAEEAAREASRPSIRLPGAPQRTAGTATPSDPSAPGQSEDAPQPAQPVAGTPPESQ